MKKCTHCGFENAEISIFCIKCGQKFNFQKLAIKETQSLNPRFHGLDALRGFAMLLGIVLHAALPYMNIGDLWPSDNSSSHVIKVIFEFIHIWRMPLFFVLAGFFANLIVSQNAWKSWYQNRFLRIFLVAIIFIPVMSLTIPWIFAYGKSGEILFFYSNAGQPHHLWFLWHLIIIVTFVAILRFIYVQFLRLRNILNRMGLSFVGNILHKCRLILSVVLFRSKVPVSLIALLFLINIPMQGELIANPMATGLYFALGFSLYGNSSLFEFLKSRFQYYFFVGLTGFVMLMFLQFNNQILDIYALDETISGKEYWGLISEAFLHLSVLLKTICAILFSYAFIGLAESRFSAYSSKLRFVSDGSYWIYLIHLPVVSFLTFSMFKIPVWIEIKFFVAIIVSAIIGLITYKYLVRSTLIGVLLNGKRIPFNKAEWFK